MSKPPTFALYVSPVQGKVFYRPGTTQILGGHRIVLANEIAAGRKQEDVEEEIATRGPIRWKPTRIFGVQTAEYGRFRKEYDRAIRDKALHVRTEADWLAQIAADEKAQTAAREAAAKAQKEAEARMTESPPDAAPAASDTP